MVCSVGGAVAALSTSARWFTTSAMISWRLSTTTYFVPPTSEMTVSGLASTRSMRSGLSAKTLPLRRVTMIMAMSIRGCVARCRSVTSASSYRQARRGPEERGPGAATRARARARDRMAGPGTGASRARVARRGSPLEVDEVLEDLVGRGHDLASSPGSPRWAMMRLVNSWARSTLLISSEPLDMRPRPPCTGHTDRADAGVGRRPVERAARLLQARRVVECGERDLAERLLDPVGEHPDERAVRREGEGLQRRPSRRRPARRHRRCPERRTG